MSFTNWFIDFHRTLAGCWHHQKFLKEAIYQTLRGGYYQLRLGVLDFLNTLVGLDIPIAIATPHSRKSLEEGIKIVGLQGYFEAIIALEDFCLGKPDGEMFEVVAEQLSLEPDVCLCLVTQT
ncbi:hypothetical protein SORBI_3006G175100 [Sorghum bicolor]|uniref:Uncharacterized protein n=1 Tax=Sorghum bicolor TaxID=4558 RepID=A0A1B6PMH3_SORBI|nr:hypothetical protein SORBI_3006G175100 [Sorghum bicolor]